MIRTLHIGDWISDERCRCIETWLPHDQVEVWTYEPVANLPRGVVVRSAGDLLPASRIWHYPNGHPGGFANEFRYHLLWTFGGWWLDTDCELLRPLDGLPDCVIAKIISLSQNWAMRFPVGHDFIRELIEVSDRMPKPTKFADTGTWLMEKLGVSKRGFLCDLSQYIKHHAWSISR